MMTKVLTPLNPSPKLTKAVSLMIRTIPKQHTREKNATMKSNSPESLLQEKIVTITRMTTRSRKKKTRH